MNPIERALERIEDALLAVACLCLGGIVAITTADVVSRAAFNAPFAWSHDLITQYLMLAMFFLSLPYVSRVGGHMSLDFLARKVRDKRMRNVLVLVGEVLAVLFVAGFVWGALGTALDAWRGGDQLQGDLPWPTWPSRLVGPVGAIMLAARLLVRIGQALAALRRGDLPAFLGQGVH